MSTIAQAEPAAEESQSGSDLPEGWASTRLGDVCMHPQYGWTTSADKNGKGLKLLRTTDISGGTVDWSTVPACQEEPDEPGKYLLETGDIVVSRAGSVGVSFLIKETPRAVFASYLIRFRPWPPIESDFISIFLKSPRYWEAIAEESAGIAIPNVNASKLTTIEVPLPPLAEQKRIVAKIEELFEQVNAARDRLAKVPKILKRFRQSVLAAACSGRLTEDWRDGDKSLPSTSKLLEAILSQRRHLWDAECMDTGRNRKYPSAIAFDKNSDLPAMPETWIWTSADSLCSQITDGEHIQPPYRAGLPMLTAKHVRDGYVVFDDAGLISDVDFKKCLQRCAPTEDDILIVSVGATTGRAAIVEKCPPFAIVRSVLLLRPLIEPRYFLSWIRSPWCFNWMQSASGASAQPHLYINDTRRMPVPLPTLQEQREIVRRVEALFKLAGMIETRVEGATKRADKLTQAILAKAFRGELVPTEAELARREGRSYEPASALLERIKAEREKPVRRV